MKNIVAKLVEVGKVELFSEEVKQLSEGEALVEIKASGICGSDMHYFQHGGLGSFKQPLPMYIGHEPSGIVIDQKNCTRVSVGDRVAIEPGRPCFTSRQSLKGKHNLCEKGTFMGATSQGSFAKYVVVSEHQLEKVPNQMSYEVAALLEPLGVALHCLNLMNIRATDNVCILGAGSIGHCVRMVCEKFGIANIYMIEKEQYRVDIAKSLGVKAFIAGKDTRQQIKMLTENLGTSCVIETAGKNESVDDCIHVAATSGKIGLIGIPDDDMLEYNPHKMRIKELTVHNVRRSNQTLLDCVKMFSVDNRPEQIVTHKYKLENIQEAFELVSNKKDGVLKCMIVS